MNDPCYAYDPVGDRAWGPFPTDSEADRFVLSDKYLESWCVLLSPDDYRIVHCRDHGTLYEPKDYHGEWPLNDEEG